MMKQNIVKNIEYINSKLLLSQERAGLKKTPKKL